MFSTFSEWLFDPSGLTPHGFCLLWRPWLISTYALADAGIGIAYFSIPVALAVIARRRSDLVFRPLLWLFAAFIMLCGTTHWIDVLTLWEPVYGLGAVVKAATALVSLFTAVALWKLLPVALVFPSPQQLREANAALAATQERLLQAQKMEIVGQLTGGVAHDFNNMMQAVSGGLTLIERRIASGRTVDIGRITQDMRRALDGAAALTNRLLAFSRQQALRPKRINPDDFVAGMREFLQRTVGPEVRVKLQLGDGRADIDCDDHELESALLNLAINARDAMPKGGEFSIAVRDRNFHEEDRAQLDQADPGAYVEIEVSDTGQGMSADTLARAFEPFFTTKPAGHGTGLGLSQVYGFVRQSGGFSRIDSAPGRGTTVFIYLPAQPRKPDGAASEAAERAEPDTARTVSGTILVVEDQDETRAQIVEALGDIGCETIEAADGLRALQIVESLRPLDLLITDIGLPLLNGRQLADAARAARPDLRILMITGYAGSALVNVSLPEGVEVLRKPFSLAELVDRAAASLAKRDEAAARGGRSA
jgi:signal transduction histidine kinase/CheY-like chemotaxis protein